MPGELKIEASADLFLAIGLDSKKCNVCRRVLRKEHFPTVRPGRGCRLNLYSKCKDCRREYARENARKRRANGSLTRDRANEIRQRCSARARQKGYVCTITQAWVKERLDKGICEVTGIPFQVGPSGGHSHPFAPSADKIDPARGYTPENTRIVCWIYNRAKSDGTDEDVMMLARALVDAGE